MVIRAMLAILCLLVAAPVASAQTVDPGDMRLELRVEDLPVDPFVGEMILLTVHGEYKIPIALEKLRQSPLDGFDWMQLGEDSWTEDTTKGRKIVVFERVIALFPNRPGEIEIAPFTHELELWTTNGRRFDHVVSSETLTITARPQPDTGKWWMPARRITVDDDWSNAPHTLGEGEGVLRIVTVTVEGVRPQQIPRMPTLGSAGAYVFAHPEKRITRLYKRGPVTRVFWRWTVRPEHPPSAYLKPISLPYFDTKAREHREIEIAAQRIAMTEEAVAAFLAEADEDSVEAMKVARNQDDPAFLRHADFAVPLALAAGCLGGLAFLLPGLRGGGRRKLAPLLARLSPDPSVKALRRAAGAGDAAAARAAAVRLIGRSEAPGMRRALARLDADLFAARSVQPDLKRFAKDILSARRSEEIAASAHSSGGSFSIRSPSSPQKKSSLL